MKCPSLPSKPVEPKKPKREFDETHEVVLGIYSGETINQWLKNKQYPHLKLTFDELINFKFDIESDYDDCYNGKLKGEVVRKRVLTDIEWWKEQEKYEGKLNHYKQKLEKYNSLIEQYHIDLENYRKWETESVRNQELTLLEKLTKKYKKN